MLDLLKFAEDAAAHDPVVPPWVIGVAAFAFLFALLFILLAFGKGRDHT